jgi:hypothetical protein
MHDHRADGDAAFRKSLPGLCNSGLEKLVFRTHRKNLTTEIAGIAGIAKLPKLGLDPTYNLGNIGDLGNSRSVHPQHASVDHKHKLSTEKKPGPFDPGKKTTREREI